MSLTSRGARLVLVGAAAVLAVALASLSPAGARAAAEVFASYAAGDMAAASWDGAAATQDGSDAWQWSDSVTVGHSPWVAVPDGGGDLTARFEAESDTDGAVVGLQFSSDCDAVGGEASAPVPSGTWAAYDLDMGAITGSGLCVRAMYVAGDSGSIWVRAAWFYVDAGDPSPEPTAEPTAEVTPEPTPEVSSEPTPSPTDTPAPAGVSCPADAPCVVTLSEDDRDLVRLVAVVGAVGASLTVFCLAGLLIASVRR